MNFGIDAAAVCQAVRDEMSAAYPDYRFDIVIDSDFSD